VTDVRREKEFGYLTAEALRTLRKEFLIEKYFRLCELCASVVNKIRKFHRGGAEDAEGEIKNNLCELRVSVVHTPSQETQKSRKDYSEKYWTGSRAKRRLAISRGAELPS
jgi:hypothetical protein